MIASNTASNNNHKQGIKHYKINHSFSWIYVFIGHIIIFWLISVSISFQNSPFFSVILSSAWLLVCGLWGKENPSFRKFLWLHAVDIWQMRETRTRQTLQAMVTSHLWNLTCFNLVIKRPKSHTKFWRAETFGSCHLQFHAKTMWFPTSFPFSPPALPDLPGFININCLQHRCCIFNILF